MYFSRANLRFSLDQVRDRVFYVFQYATFIIKFIWTSKHKSVKYLYVHKKKYWHYCHTILNLDMDDVWLNTFWNIGKGKYSVRPIYRERCENHIDYWCQWLQFLSWFMNTFCCDSLLIFAWTIKHIDVQIWSIEPAEIYKICTLIYHCSSRELINWIQWSDMHEGRSKTIMFSLGDT